MTSPEVIAQLAKLSQREREALRLVCAGLLYREVAEKIYVAESTVKADMGRVYLKLGLNSLSREQRRLKLQGCISRTERKGGFFGPN